MTPLIKLDNYYFKREDQNQTGSAKDRSISLQVEHLLQNNFHSAVISSSGNAAISAIFYCRQKNVNLTIFLSPKINIHKLELIKKETSSFHLTNTPNSDAFKYAKNHQAYLLRQSTDPIALTGYQQIAEEIIEQLPKVTSIFVPVGSGTTLLGISQKLPSTVKIFAVQPASHCPISSVFDQKYSPETKTITDALSVKLLPLKPKVITAIKKTNGSGFVVQNKAVVSSQDYLISQKIITSPEGALALAGLSKAQKNKADIGNYPVLLLTGAAR
ncbi:MAG: PLP-dependent lyase/thiolase [Candidatus Shapirobacteria bacterium]